MPTTGSGADRGNLRLGSRGLGNNASSPRRHLADYPRDALALQVGHVADFYHGDRDNLRGRIARALPFWRRDDLGYSFVLGMYAGLEECADYARAEQTGREALAIEPDDCWAHHAVTHVMEMQARQATGSPG